MPNISKDEKNSALAEGLSITSRQRERSWREILATDERRRHIPHAKQIAVFLTLVFALLARFPSGAKAQDPGNEVIVPAGTLLRCTLNEPNFSSKTAEVGDPVICNLGSLVLFDRSVFPRGAYLQGHLEAEKEPGHFVGKGYLNLQFDRIGTPDGQVPIPAKIIGARGYKVDQKGDIVGHGHATRDAVEWMIPLLWPVKVLTLPDRGPRPTLKGEEQLTLRLMDDLAVPTPPVASQRSYGRPSAQQSLPGPYDILPNRYIPSRAPAPKQVPTNGSQQVTATASGPSSTQVQTEKGPQNVLIMRNGNTYIANNLRVDGNRLNYALTDGTPAAVRMEDVDWTRTFQANAQNGVTIAMNGDGAAR